MDWISEIIWPLLIAFLSVVFRKPIESLSRRLVRFKYKELSLEFESPHHLVGSCSGDFTRYWSKVGCNGRLNTMARLTALHDLGKYNHVFQRRFQKC
jgi:hypothetical protein